MLHRFLHLEPRAAVSRLLELEMGIATSGPIVGAGELDSRLDKLALCDPHGRERADGRHSATPDRGDQTGSKLPMNHLDTSPPAADWCCLLLRLDHLI